MNTVLQTIIASGSAHGTPMQRAIFGYLPNATNFYLDNITIEGKGQYIYTLGGEKVVTDLEDDFSGSIWVPAADAGSKLIVRGEAITEISQDEQQQLTELNVSGLTALTSLDCSHNSLTELNVSGLTALTRLECDYNSLTELNVSGLTALTSLDCSHNSLTELNVSGLTALTSLYCGDNSLTELNVSGLTALTLLYCVYNSLTELNVSGLIALTSLYCSYNSLTELNVSGLTALTSLDCGYNSMIKSISFNATAQDPATDVANLITAADSATGEVYLNSSDTYYSTVADAATAKGWAIKPL